MKTTPVVLILGLCGGWLLGTGMPAPPTYGSLSPQRASVETPKPIGHVPLSKVSTPTTSQGTARNFVYPVNERNFVVAMAAPKKKIEEEKKPAKDEHVGHKTCGCSPDCTCGCNEGKPCICGNPPLSPTAIGESCGLGGRRFFGDGGSRGGCRS